MHCSWPIDRNVDSPHFPKHKFPIHACSNAAATRDGSTVHYNETCVDGHLYLETSLIPRPSSLFL